MLQTLWFMLKTVLIVTVTMWLISLGGVINVQFSDYGFSTSLGVFALILFALFWCLSIILRVVKAIINTPKTIATYTEKRAQKLGLQSLAFGLSAVAANDVRMAQYYATRTTRYLKHDFGLGHILNALTARLGNETRLETKSFHAALKHKETSFLGYKSLINTALDNNDFRYARVLMTQAHQNHPNNPWVLKCHYDIETRTEHFENATGILKEKLKNGLLSKQDYKHENAYLIYAMGDWEKAYKHNPDSLPLGLAALKKITVEGKHRKAQKIIRRLWAINPHPDLINHWVALAPKSTAKKPNMMIKWIEDLHAHNADDASSNLYIGQALMKTGFQKHARTYIENALRLKPTLSTYQAMNTIDPVGQWMQNITHAIDDKIWVCAQTGKKYGDWSITTPDKYFNSLAWDYPSETLPSQKSLNQLF